MLKKKLVLWVAIAGIAAAVGFYLFREKHQLPPTVSDHRPTNAASRVSSAQTKALLSEIRGKSSPTGLRVMLIGWDAADWQSVEPLMSQGKLPNLRRLVENGTRAYLRSSKPMLSPLLWTSIATGKYPTEHGVLDFLVTDPQTKKPTPINSTFRKSMALWNILSQAGRSNAFVAWWATWPAEPVNGVMVTDRVSYSLFSSVAETSPEKRLTWPENYYSQVKPKLISEKDVTDQELSAFIHLSPEQISKERKVVYPPGKTNPVSYLAQIIASTRNYNTISLDLLSKRKFDLFSCYFEGIDQAGHLFQHYMTPKMAMVTDEEYRRYKDVVPRFYEFVDQLTGNLLKYASSDMVVILLSDHGFKNGPGRPTDYLPFINERPAYWHRGYGVFVISGGPVRKGLSMDTVTIFDAAPTTLYLLGLPIGKDLHGEVLTHALSRDFVQKYQPQAIASWEPLKLQPEVQQQASNSNVDQEVMENLAALGYIGNQGSTAKNEVFGTENATFHLNLASIYLTEKKYDLAEKEIEKSMKLGVLFETYEYLFQIKKARGESEEAGRALELGLQKFPRFPPEGFLRLIDHYVSIGRLQDARRVYQQYGPAISLEKFKIHCSGLIKEGSGDLAGAESDYLAALKVDPTCYFSMERLYTMYRERGKLDKLEPTVKAGLRVNDQLPFYHNVLGIVYKRRGNYKAAVQEYQKAISGDPDNPTYLANLGAAYLSMQKLDLAEEILVRAQSKNEKDPEVALNLGAVYLKMGRLDESLSAFRRVKQMGVHSPNVELGIAVAFAEKGNIPEAIQTVEAALQQYPNHPDLRELLATLKHQ